MKPVEFVGMNARVAEHQDEYETLPAFVSRTPDGEVTSCWELTEEERAQVQETGRVWLSCCTFGDALQPVRLSVERPASVPGEDARASVAELREGIANVDRTLERLDAAMDEMRVKRVRLVQELAAAE